MFKQAEYFKSSMTLVQVLEQEVQLRQMHEVRVVFDDKQELERMCSAILGQNVSGYNITENKTGYVWEGKKQETTNYVASTIVQNKGVERVVLYFYQEIKKKWKTPLIQVIPCFVNKSFYEYTLTDKQTEHLQN